MTNMSASETTTVPATETLAPVETETQMVDRLCREAAARAAAHRSGRRAARREY